MSDQKRFSPASCASCDLERGVRACTQKDGKGAKGCPSLTHMEVLKASNEEYKNPEINEFARQASIQEGECYANRHERPYVMQPSKTRIMEIYEFAKKNGVQKAGPGLLRRSETGGFHSRGDPAAKRI